MVVILPSQLCVCPHNANNAVEKGEQAVTWVHQVAQAMEEQLREDQQELKMREQKKKVEDARRIHGTVHENDKNKGTSHRHNEVEKLMHHDEQYCSACGKGGIGMTP